MTIPSAAIIIPAWNEERTIARCLRAVAQQSFTGNLHVVLVSNGSADRTVEVAEGQRSQFEARGWMVTILGIPEASKTAALNVGDPLADGDVQIYLDADAALSPNAVAALAEAVGSEPRLAAPKLVIAPGNRLFSRAYARTWRRLPPVSDDVIGCGCLAVNRAGRARFGKFPDVIADDLFVRMQFARSERVLVESASFEVPFPDDDALLSVLSRWQQGNMELAEMGFELDDRALNVRRLRTLACSPSIWLDMPIYALISFQARETAKKQLRNGDRTWHRAGR